LQTAWQQAMNLIDRMLTRSFVKAYIVCLVSLLSLYIVVDLFTNLEDFYENHDSLAAVLKHIGTYYGFKVTQIFDRLCEPIVLMAAAFTVAWAQRSNELIPLLSGGVSIQRVVRPILIASGFMLILAIINQEFIIPKIGNYLANDRDDPDGSKELVVQGAYEPNGIHLEGRVGSRKELLVKEFYVVIPQNIAGALINLSAVEAHYVPPGQGTYTGVDGFSSDRRGGWLLTRTTPAELENWNNKEVLESIDPGKYFLKTAEVDFDVITRARNWYNFASTARLCSELRKADSARLAAMAVLFHTRLVRPLLGFILVLSGVALILKDQNRNIFISAGFCVGLCGIFFAVTFACKSLGDNEYLPPSLAAWAPILYFGPFSVAWFERMQT
jgi:lipopolysaccharide export system permease protein